MEMSQKPGLCLTSDPLCLPRLLDACPRTSPTVFSSTSTYSTGTVTVQYKVGLRLPISRLLEHVYNLQTNRSKEPSVAQALLLVLQLLIDSHWGSRNEESSTPTWRNIGDVILPYLLAPYC